MKYQNLVLAGSFDHLHLGHKYFIEKAYLCSQKISCYLATGWTAKQKLYSLAIQSYKDRYRTLDKYINENGLENKIAIYPLDNGFGPALEYSKLDAIAYTAQNYQKVKLINSLRIKKNLKPLTPIFIDLIKAQDKKIISSTRIRLGEINRNGFVYHHFLPNNKSLYLPYHQRSFFQKPIGKLLKGSHTNLLWASQQALRYVKKNLPPLIITVGDITTQACLINNIPINLAIIDYRSQRQPISFNLHTSLQKSAFSLGSCDNNPGTISKKTIAKLKQILPKIIISKKLSFLEINGEEDLLVLPLILLAPLQTAILYGQPQKGIVQVVVTEILKEKMVSLLTKFL